MFAHPVSGVTPAVAGKALFVRTDSHVYRIESGATPGKPGR